jgi:glycosyltransferase involved in cell wall biosynthesis/2-polyprenyl-3-methyl-5-hydroxy-6-metoxy-1,4-benzoquinol methylase
MKDVNPLISLIMPVYNDGLYIREAILSLLEQSYSNFELIVSDDVSTDNSYTICKKYQNLDKRLKLYQNKTNLGPYKNWKNAVAHVTGKYVMFITGHDKWDRYMLETYVNEMEKDSNCTLVYSQTTLIKDNGSIIKSRDVDKLLDTYSFFTFYAIIKGDINSDAFCGLIRTETLLRTSLQPASIGNDTIFLAELSLFGKFKQLNNHLYYRRKNRVAENIQEKLKRYSANITRNLSQYWNSVYKNNPYIHMVYQYLCMVQNNNLTIKDQGVLFEMIFDTFQKWGVDPHDVIEVVLRAENDLSATRSTFTESGIKVGNQNTKCQKLLVDYTKLKKALEQTRYKRFFKIDEKENLINPKMINKKFPSNNKYDVCYILEDTGKWGGVKGTFVQANGLKDLGYNVVVVSKANAPNWYELECDFVQLKEIEVYDLPTSDIYIGTWYKTLKYINKIKNSIKLHYCRGYEGNFEYFSKEDISEIEEIYNYNTIKIANSKSVQTFLNKKFNTKAHCIKNDLNTDCFCPSRNKVISPEIKILVVGPYEINWKGIRKAIEIVSKFKLEVGFDRVKLIRVSQAEISREEKAILDSEFKNNYEYNFDLNETQMAVVYNESTIFLSGSHSQESFGRPAMEALACGLPAVLTDISAYKDYDAVHDYCLFYNVGDVNMAIRTMKQIMIDGSVKQRLIRRGLEVASRYSIKSTIKELEELLTKLYKENETKNMSYYSYTRPEVQKLVNINSRVILDVGCANGSMGMELKSKLDAEVWGVEYDKDAANVARSKLNRVLEGDINSILGNLPENYFDTIIFADILEHTPRPDIILSKIRNNIKRSGELVISLPNVRHWTVIKNLLEGDWKYEEAGLLDKTHLQFFTKKSIIRMMSNLNFVILEMFATRFDFEKIPKDIVSDLSRYGIDTSTLIEESQDYQYIFKCKLK